MLTNTVVQAEKEVGHSDGKQQKRTQQLKKKKVRFRGVYMSWSILIKYEDN